MSNLKKEYGFPAIRLRRTRAAAWSRALVAEHRLSSADFVLPIFMQEGVNKKTLISSMPGVHRLSIDLAVKEAKRAEALGIPAIALFPHVEQKLKSGDAEEA